MADSWDADDFTPVAPSAIKKGEKNEFGEELDDVQVKDSWDQEDEPPKPAPKPKQKADKSATAAASTTASKDVKEMTEEEKKKAQEAADLGNTAELFGLSKPLDEFSLKTKEDCSEYVNRLYYKLNPFHNSTHYTDFLDELFRSLCKNLSADSVRKLSNSIKAFSDAKTGEEKLAKQKENKTKGVKGAKATLKVGKSAIGKGGFDDFLKDDLEAEAYDEDEGDDFM